MTNDEILRRLKDGIWLKPTETIFKALKKHGIGNMKTRRVFIERGGPVLFVAHLDTIRPPRFIRTRLAKNMEFERIYARGLDDRLGAMLAFELSKELRVDLLFTDHEESGGTTCKFHACKEYNWIVEFDRAGNDVVTYGCSSDEFDRALKEYWCIGNGIYSDICELKTKACCFNLGIGYELAHGKDSYCNIKVTQEQVKLFKEFYRKYRDTRFVQDGSLQGRYDLWSNSSNTGICDICGGYSAEPVFNFYICKDCFENMIYARVNEQYGNDGYIESGV
jgi:hypothetical protein